jgi:hypothetical protein
LSLSAPGDGRGACADGEARFAAEERRKETAKRASRAPSRGGHFRWPASGTAFRQMSTMTLEREGHTGTAAWPPAALRGQVVLRHWRSSGFLAWQNTGLLDANDLDPGFTAPSAAFKACLDPWRTSTTPTATHSYVSLVNVESGAYTGIRDTAVVYVASSSKAGIMYPVVQLIHDIAVIEEREKPATDAALFEAVRKQWAQDLVDARAVGTLAKARRWIDANGPKLERCAKRNPTAKISDELNDALESMVIRSDDAGRNLCIQLVGEPYITSVLSQSGELRALKPLSWESSTRALAALATLLTKLKLVSPLGSIWMMELLKLSADSVGTWTRYALKGADGGPTRPFAEIAGKIGFLYGGPRSTWFDNVTVMGDVTLVKKPDGKVYVLSFAIPYFAKVIKQGDLLPLIRGVHDCV